MLVALMNREQAASAHLNPAAPRGAAPARRYGARQPVASCGRLARKAA